ncbi:MAG: peptide-methionine (S)-S-oxide reductase MsrA [Gemmatimonadota bacterium]|nr:peptide-methionine (S)-S-oxide reductase MsrA [Gemmatimonadota bacterium]MDH5758443.1 peptide-methionine (S)-S-oxide reductase MsrA [Gemmatimonadota bacterium]
MSASANTETVTLGGGCFWCIEAVFEEIRGVEGVRSGYSGGRWPAPSYERVCSGTTGHAEVVQVTFRPDVVPLRDILEIFFAVHDPTTPDRQGADVGTQYRSVIFTHSDSQFRVAREVIAELNAAEIWPDPIVTEVAPLGDFHAAEDYHQGYFRRNPGQGYCRVVIAPKVLALRRRFAHRIVESP